MKKFVLAVIGIALFAMTGVAFAAQVTNNIQVLASVADTCRMTTEATNIDFGSYDPTNTSADIDGSSSISFRCTKNTTYWTYITRTGNMINGSNNLPYQLYTDAGRSTAWNSAKTGGGTVSPNNGIRQLDIYGRIAPLEDVPAGNYFENVTVTIEY